MQLSRRYFNRQLVRAMAGFGLLPEILRAQKSPGLAVSSRPRVIGGAITGDLIGQSAVFWSRCDRPATMLLEFSTRESFQNASRVRGPAALDDIDFAAKLTVQDLPAGQTIFYRLAFEDITDTSLLSEPVLGSFRTAPLAKRDILFAWSGDTVGQGYGIDLSRGGMKTYETIRRLKPDFFVHSGDTIYADKPLETELKLDDGTVWKNLVTDAKSKVAETISEFRGNHFYNLLDENVRRFHSEVPVFFQWDDHEVLDNWYPGKILDDTRYTEKNVSLLAAHSRRAFFECLPIRPHPLERIFRNVPYGPSLELFLLDLRSYRGANSPNRQTEMDASSAYFGRFQLDELKRALLASKATWKVFCSDMPLGLMVGDGKTDFENSSNGDGPALGRELEIAELLQFLKHNRIRNTIWLTADVHHAASVYYDPNKAVFQEFEPFWEFISGPLHAGTFGHPPLDNTFGPETRFLGIPKSMKSDRPPSDGLQFSGTVGIDSHTEELTVTQWNVAGDKLWSITLPPRYSA
ncbi:MAG: alkaline phosphatase [Pedosphaera sp.]|nr:alkaline phosphatase [Pedosphaera sp.]